MSSTEVFNLYRSIYSFKSMTTSFESEPVKLIEVVKPESNIKLEEFDTTFEPGQLLFCRRSKKLFVYCADGNCLEIKQLMIGKRKAMSAVSFYNGFLSKCEKSERHFKQVNKQ